MKFYNVGDKIVEAGKSQMEMELGGGYWAMIMNWDFILKLT